MSNLRDAYEAVIYCSSHRAASAPDRLAAIATLFGLDRPDPETARVLEIGCSDGGNLIPLASATPGGTFLGIDFAEAAISIGTARVADLGLANINLQRMDIAEFPANSGSFDYIIAHGVFSWVSPQTRGAILQVVQRHLSPSGVAYIDYNAQPGSHLRYTFREAMFFHVGQFAEPQQRIEQARALLKLIIEANPPGSIYRSLAERELRRLQRTPDWVVFHDDLSEYNEAFYFRDFIKAAEDHGLQYLAEADVATMNPARLPENARKALGGLGKLVQREQYLDILTHREFRQTLLCHAVRTIDRALNRSTLEGLRFSTQVEIAPGHSDGELVFRAGATTLATTNRLAQVALESVRNHTGPLLNLSELAAQIRAKIPARPTEIENSLRAVMLHCIMSGLVEIHVRATPGSES